VNLLKDIIIHPQAFFLDEEICLIKDFLPEEIFNSILEITNNATVSDWDKFNPNSNGLKTCVPFLDGLLSGYMLLTWTDIYIKILEDGSLDIDWGSENTGLAIAERSPKSGSHIPRPAGHLPNHLVWTPKWGVKSPRGWSSLFTHPLNRFDLPFTTMSAIIDSDKYFSSGNIPFFIKEGFEGLIPKGTPYAQVIPIKRANWTAVYDPSLIEAAHELGHETRSVERGRYRDKMWVKKVYHNTVEKGKQNG